MRDAIIWDNIPSGYLGGTLASSQHDTVYPFRSGVADDFICNPDPTDPICVVTDVHWWGGFWNGSPPWPNPDFYINIYADAGGMPTGAGMPDPEPTALYAYDIPYGDIVVTELDPDTYMYELDLPEPAMLDCGGYYWLEIVAVHTFPPQWGWASSADQQLNFAHQGFPLLGLEFWTMIEYDMAFQITGYCIPEPASLALLGLGGLALLRRR
jgi:hypothetical protein